jgi:hypothetical protein
MLFISRSPTFICVPRKTSCKTFYWLNNQTLDNKKTSGKNTNSKFFLNFLNFIIFTFTHMCIHCLSPFHFQAEPFCPLVLWFCWRENIRDNKKDTAFLVVWDKDSCTERFLVLLTCWVHQPQSSFRFPSLSAFLPCVFSP